MAIIVEHAQTNFPQIIQVDNTAWRQRIEQSHKYGFPLRDALPTYPRELSTVEWVRYAVENIRHRRPSDGIMFYTLTGLLHTIYSFFELESDHSNGITRLQDIANTTIKLDGYTQNLRCSNDLEQKGSINIPDFVYKKGGKAFLNDGLMRDVTDLVINSAKRSRIEIDHYEILDLAKVEGILTIHPNINGAPQDRIELARLKLKAFNLPNMGDDMDNVTTLALWGEQ
jgi:hypothetical protein